LGEDPAASTELDRLADRASAKFTSGGDVGLGPVTFSRSGWPSFAERIREALEDAGERERAATERAEAAEAESEQLRRLATQRSAALVETRSVGSERSQQDAARLTTNLLKPVAMALADSYEADSLAALRDRLLVVLQRGRVKPIHQPGDVVEFDPIRHQWVGEGYPTDRVKALSPGFMVSGEDDEDVVVVPARVVAP
jgi:hypothetical protein